MLQAKDAAKYTENELDFHICNALIKATLNPTSADGVTRHWLVSEIERATAISEYLTPVVAQPDKVSKRLTALHKLNIIKCRKSASKYKWSYNTGITLEQLIETQQIKNAVLDIEPVKSKVVITTVDAVKPFNTKTDININKSSNSETTNLINIKNNSSPINSDLVYYFIRYKGLYRQKAVLQTSNIVALPFAIYNQDHQKQMEEYILEEMRLRMLIDEIQMILISRL